MTNEEEVEKLLNEKNLNAPRLPPKAIDKVIKTVEYYVFPGSCITVCCLTLTNRFSVIGESACASPENFDKETGASLAFKNARDKIWMLEGYLLKQVLYEEVKKEILDKEKNKNEGAP